MRVTENTNFEVIRDSIRRSKGRMENLQRENSTLKKLNAPSDDPIGSAKVMELRTDKVNNDQFQMNSKLAETFLTNSEHALAEMTDLLVRAKEIALSQSSGASSTADTRLGVAEEVTQLYNQAVSTANRRVGDRYLFGGYRTNKPAVDPDGHYLGDDGQMMVEIAKDVYLSMNVTGKEAFNTHPESLKKGDSSDGGAATDGRTPASAKGPEAQARAEPEEGRPENVNVFDELQSLRIGLLTGDLETIRGTLDRLDQAHDRVVAMRAKVGSRLQGLQSAYESIDRHNLTNAQLSSALEDADMAQVVSDLAKEETVFRSALSSSQKLIQPTLLDFLK